MADAVEVEYDPDANFDASSKINSILFYSYDTERSLWTLLEDVKELMAEEIHVEDYDPLIARGNAF